MDLLDRVVEPEARAAGPLRDYAPIGTGPAHSLPRHRRNSRAVPHGRPDEPPRIPPNATRRLRPRVRFWSRRLSMTPDRHPFARAHGRIRILTATADRSDAGRWPARAAAVPGPIGAPCRLVERSRAARTARRRH